MSKMSKHLQTVAGMACMKTLLMVFNFVFWVSGIVLLACGIWMQVELYKYFVLSGEFPVTGPYVLIGTGALIVMVGSFACCCTIKGQPALLYMYGAFLALIFVIELGAGVSIFAYRSKLTESFNEGLNSSMVDYKNGVQNKIEAYDWMQIHLRCCGVRGPSDWTTEPHRVPVPLSCCKDDSNCDVGDESAYFSQGCYDKVIDFLGNCIGVVAGSAVGITLFPVLGLFLACCLATTINKAKYEQMA